MGFWTPVHYLELVVKEISEFQPESANSDFSGDEISHKRIFSL